ncbi:ATP-binding protein [Solwaraspora sp. WMMA2080]|uniref:ATP-binding protein n=1 Tax=unclassified Solwaraspora TaxID=2627926 RepID=UPI00248B1C84|nr:MULTISPECIES: ATP-binding protein [unclassified Solwaraspora]WBB96019.1 ATP-binding protein [Solwaraspora sp. WMMA2059]WBC20077.1 ATP-binding protein [Solwaraspora sp. WMMA2080]
MDGITAGVNELLGLLSALLAVIAAVLALPPLIGRWRRGGQPRRQPPKILLPSRTQLVDRTDEVAQVLQHLDRGEYLVSIEGSIGAGKSALATEVAHRLAQRGTGRQKARAYASLVWFDAHNGALGLADLARTLGLAAGDPTLSAAPAEHKAEVLRAFLASHPAVLVIDNLRLTATDAHHLVDFLRTLPSGSLAIVSANTPGRLPAPRVMLQELQQRYTEELLIREATRRGVTDILNADRATLSRLHELLGGNPRAIELFALACAHEGRSFSIRLGQLEAGSTQLTDALFTAVWHDISTTGRSLLSVCAFLNGSANAEQLCVALNLPQGEVEDLAERLWSDGLISSHQRHDTTFYTCSAALRLFVLNHTSQEELNGIATCLADHFISRFGQHWEDASGAEAHLDAIRLLIRDRHHNRAFEQSFKLFEVTLDIFFTLGLFDDRIDLGWVAYQAATARGQSEERSLALSVISSTHAIRGEEAAAARTADLGLRIAREIGSVKEIARQLRCVGFQLFRAGKAVEALAVVKNAGEDAEEMARSVGDFNNMIDIQSLVGAAYWHLGRVDQCARTVRRFLDSCEELPWERGKAYAIRDLAEVTMMGGAFQDAMLLLDQARRIAVRYRDVRQLVRVDLTDARLHLFQGRMIRARRYALQAAADAHSLSLIGEQAEAEALARYAVRALFWPWLWLVVFRKPRIRFTEMTVGGD